MPGRPRTVAFDVVETLMSLEPLRPRLADAGLEPHLLERWFDRLLRDGTALSLTGDYVPFPRVAAAALHSLARGGLSGEAVEHVLAGFADLPAHPDAEPAMRALAAEGISMVCLSNGTAEATTAFLERTGLHIYIDQVISAAEAACWKPDRRVYEHALKRIDRPGGEVALVAVHAFDCHGAKRAGLTTGWAARLEGVYTEGFAAPDVRGEDLPAVVRGLLALPDESAG